MELTKYYEISADADVLTETGVLAAVENHLDSQARVRELPQRLADPDTEFKRLVLKDIESRHRNDWTHEERATFDAGIDAYLNQLSPQPVDIVASKEGDSERD